MGKSNAHKKERLHDRKFSLQNEGLSQALFSFGGHTAIREHRMTARDVENLKNLMHGNNWETFSSSIAYSQVIWSMRRYAEAVVNEAFEKMHRAINGAPLPRQAASPSDLETYVDQDPDLRNALGAAVNDYFASTKRLGAQDEQQCDSEHDAGSNDPDKCDSSRAVSTEFRESAGVDSTGASSLDAPRPDAEIASSSFPADGETSARDEDRTGEGTRSED